jgi:hypothetical protein
MAPNRITPSGATRRGLAAAAATVALLAALAGCGGGGTSGTGAAAGAAATTSGTAQEVSTPTPSPEQAADAAVLNTVLSRQEAAIEAFAAVGPALPPRLARMAAYFRAQEQEHVDAVLKELRDLKESPAEPTPEEIDTSAPKDTRERLVFLYEVESATIGEELRAISELEEGDLRSLLASTVANQAQHLTLLRRALGAAPLAQIPVPFENGAFPPPVG